MTDRLRLSFGSGARRTARALTASALGVLPLIELFKDARWVYDVWLTMLVVIVPGLMLRLWQRPKVWHIWVGLALLVPWLTARFAKQHAFGGFLPTRGTWHDIDALMSEVRRTTDNGVAPVHASPAIVFLLALVLGLLAAFIDLVAVVARRPALAGVPLLVIYTVSGAVPRHPVSWLLFLAGGGAFLLLLSLDAADTVREWGRVIPRLGETRAAAGLSVSGPRIAVLALAVAVLLPLVAPSRPTNLIADALHNGTSHGGKGTGFGAASGVSLDPFAALKGDLQRTKPVNLFTVTVDPRTTVVPFYLRANVLANYSEAGWSAEGHGDTLNLVATTFDTVPPTDPTLITSHFAARVKISGLSDNPPVFERPSAVSGLDTNATWSRSDMLLLGVRVHRDDEIVEQIDQPAPTVEQLSTAPTGETDPQELARWLRVPTSMPAEVRDLVGRVTTSKTTQYDKARALSDYFTDPSNGFTYRLETKAGDSGSDLVDFLNNKAGYCQQFAAAMGIMLRMAGVPSRVVLGYTHANPDSNGVFTVTTTNAHAWVEAYFDGLGWIPFDPTPIAGAAGGATTSLAWAPHATFNTGPSSTATASNPSKPTVEASGNASGASSANRGSGSGPGFSWQLLVVVIVLIMLLIVASVPAALRWRRRRGRLRAARRGDPDPLWAELSDTAIDLGYVWSDARTPRQVVGWLAPQVRGEPATSLRTLASAIESSRYAPSAADLRSQLLVTDLRAVEGQLRQRRSTSTRIRSRLLPASLGLRLRLPRRGRRER
jgi:transglutaminase-like putative cysteine protease